VTPRPSATVLLLRGTKPFELLLIRRPGGADFAPGAYVFPGGAVHSQDAEWGDDVAAAAVRELFEEVGILLARRGRRFARDPDGKKVRELIAQGMDFSHALRESGLEPAHDRLAYLARWVTPLQLRRRFDARFFLALMPAGQTVMPQAGEVGEWLWVRPDQALRDPDITLVYATRSVLESVATGEGAPSLMARARHNVNVPIIEPRLIQTENGWEVVR
jgi:8-oxo-dGTP pyrophosphatase MutT (NUDIX family)